ncbi:MAG: hypothetical protein IJD03_05150, partial [Clostridia bacterium]|nr:hypothetical protein [Clostridia bacterium]
ENSSNSMVRISSFSYNLQLNSGYSLENINCYYFSFNSETDLSEYNDIDLETLSLIDFPTNRLGWVRSDTQAVELQMNTGVRYTLELNMVDEYMLQHNLVPFNFVEQ